MTKLVGEQTDYLKESNLLLRGLRLAWGFLGLGTDMCQCSKCGTKIPRVPGSVCKGMKCSKCGAPLAEMYEDEFEVLEGPAHDPDWENYFEQEGEEEEITLLCTCEKGLEIGEVRAKRIRGKSLGRKVVRIKCPTGYKLDTASNSCRKLTPQELRKKKLAAKKAHRGSASARAARTRKKYN